MRFLDLVPYGEGPCAAASVVFDPFTAGKDDDVDEAAVMGWDSKSIAAAGAATSVGRLEGGGVVELGVEWEGKMEGPLGCKSSSAVGFAG